MKEMMFFRLRKNYCFAVITLSAAMTPRVTLAAQPVAGPYFGIEGGVTWLNNQTLLSNRGKNEFHYWFSPGGLGGITAGYSFANGFRPELELSYRHSELDQGQNSALTAVSTESASGSESAAIAMGNLWYDYRLGNGILGNIHPYMGIGIGIARLGIRHFSIPKITGANDINSYRSTWAYQLGAGFYADITRRLVASIGWRWLQTPRFNVPSALAAGDVHSRYQSESLILAVRYVFGSTKSF